MSDDQRIRFFINKHICSTIELIFTWNSLILCCITSPLNTTMSKREHFWQNSFSIFIMENSPFFSRNNFLKHKDDFFRKLSSNRFPRESFKEKSNFVGLFCNSPKDHLLFFFEHWNSEWFFRSFFRMKYLLYFIFRDYETVSLNLSFLFNAFVASSFSEEFSSRWNRLDFPLPNDQLRKSCLISVEDHSFTV